jgi:hypothetical protein
MKSEAGRARGRTGTYYEACVSRLLLAKLGYNMVTLLDRVRDSGLMKWSAVFLTAFFRVLLHLSTIQTY